MKLNIFKIFIVIGFLVLTGCLSPVKVEQQPTYQLNTVPEYVPTKRMRNATLIVFPPVSDAAYNTTQIAYTTRPYQIGYYVNNHWAETPAQMLQPLLVKTLQRTHHFRAVVTPPYVGNYDYVLGTHISKLQMNFIRCPAVVELSARVTLTRIIDNQIIGVREFNIVEPLPRRTPYGGVIAANQATARLLQQVAEFTLEKIR